MKLKKGAAVYWNDPDHGLCSGWGVVVETHEEPLEANTMVRLQMVSGGEVECFACELWLNPFKQY